MNSHRNGRGAPHAAPGDDAVASPAPAIPEGGQAESGLSLGTARRLVVKIGSALVVDAAHAAPRMAWLAGIAADIAALRARGVDVIVVSSGAIALARRTLKLTQKRLRLEEKQAAAAVGQIRLAQAWTEVLSGHGLTAAQLLLTVDDTEDRRRYLNARATLTTLMGLGCIPVINENDSVATAEIRFGDNDRLAARVAEMVEADQLILLSDIDGLYTADPRRDPEARHIPVVSRLTDEIEAMGGEPPPGYSSGGMRTKLLAARIATGAGCAMAITIGQVEHPLAALEAGARCTWFLPAPEGRSARKRWILGTLQPQGSFTIDAGAARALADGRSLLPAGVTALAGSFSRGDAVEVCGPDGTRLARGLSAYASEDAARIIGHRSEDIEAILGWRGRTELIHRDDLVLL
ncbi:glutamate 5-kinase [Rhodovastum atsumiense]|uniref:Glutamate 5-kinase n=1 Tax=Rhodovastum atsumiense TaxID=504468 RepID=A0A5M6IUC7_9PROT|nr:glutamate 5-kinase [Rhodovastum atsumiense]KAA5610985.1 glutamate 5-kinase [Rhodovastum atsumiense]